MTKHQDMNKWFFEPGGIFALVALCLCPALAGDAYGRNNIRFAFCDV